MKFLKFFSIFKSPASRKENVRFPDSPDFDNLPDFRTGLDVRLSPIVTITYNNASEWILTHCALCSCYFNAMGTTPFVSDQVCTSLVLVSLFAIQRQPASQASYTSTYSHCQVVRILYLCLQGLQLKIAKYPTPGRYNYEEENSIEGMKKLRNLLSVFDYRQFKFDKRCSDAHLWPFLFYYYCNTT